MFEVRHTVRRPATILSVSMTAKTSAKEVVGPVFRVLAAESAEFRVESGEKQSFTSTAKIINGIPLCQQKTTKQNVPRITPAFGIRVKSGYRDAIVPAIFDFHDGVFHCFVTLCLSSFIWFFCLFLRLPTFKFEPTWTVQFILPVKGKKWKDSASRRKRAEEN